MIAMLPRIGIAVRDMDRATSVFRDRFGIPTHEFAWAPEKLGARMALASGGDGTHIELLAPDDPVRPHSRVFLRFLERHGEGLYALMLNAEDPDAEAAALERRGLPVMPLMPEAGGRDLHPRDTCGVLIRIYPTHTNQMVEPELTQAIGPIAARRGAAGLSSIRRVLVAVRDLDAAVAVYRDRLGLETVMRPRQAMCTPPEGARIELLASDVLPEGMFALVLESDDVAGSVAALRANGLTPHPVADAPGVWEIDRDAGCGVLFRIEASSRVSPGGLPWS